MYEGKVLEDLSLLKEQGLQDGSEVQLTLKLRGGQGTWVYLKRRGRITVLDLEEISEQAIRHQIDSRFKPIKHERRTLTIGGF